MQRPRGGRSGCQSGSPYIPSRSLSTLPSPATSYEMAEPLPTYTFLAGTIHIKVLALLKAVLVLYSMARESQYQLDDLVCKNSTHFIECRRSSCAWLHLSVGNLPRVFLHDSTCNFLFVALFFCCLLLLLALWQREREMAGSVKTRPILKILLLAPVTIIEIGFLIALFYSGYLAVYRKMQTFTTLSMSLLHALLSSSLGMASLTVHAVTSAYICDGIPEDTRPIQASSSYSSTSHRIKEEESLLPSGQPLSSVHPNTFRPSNEQKNSSSEESGVSSMGYSRLRQALYAAVTGQRWETERSRDRCLASKCGPSSDYLEGNSSHPSWLSSDSGNHFSLPLSAEQLLSSRVAMMREKAPSSKRSSLEGMHGLELGLGDSLPESAYLEVI